MSAQSSPKRVVIVGGGFGGLYAAQSLAKANVEITVIDRRNFHLFQPLLYQVATGALSAAEIASPIRWILRKQKNTRVVLAEAMDVDAENRRLITDIGTFDYDWLIVATGMRNHYYGHDEWEQHAPGLKTIEEAANIRQRVLFAFEAAEREKDIAKQTAWLTFLVVGAGPTGVELAGALGEIARQTLREDFRAIRPEMARILLIDGADRVLPFFHPDLSASAERSLLRVGVRSMLNARVIDMDEDGLTLRTDAGEVRIPAKTVIWAAGVKPAPFANALVQKAGGRTEPNGQIVIEPNCSIGGHPEIFVIGDMASFRYDGHPLPGVAQVAMQQGTYVGKSIIRQIEGKPPQKRFKYFDKGAMAVIGRAKAVAQSGPFRFTGFIAWLAWLFIHLIYLVDVPHRVIVLIRWAYLYLNFHRGSRLITGREHMEGPAGVSDIEL